MADSSMLTPQFFVPALMAVGAVAATIKIYGGRLTKLEGKDEFCSFHRELFEKIQRDLEYLRARMDQVVDRLGK